LPPPRLHELYPALAASLPHLRLADPPTPVRRLDVGPVEAWVKDESPYGGPWGGNKVRKLEWILPDAQRRGARTILTFGALATNHGLATALYAREQGLGCAIALIDQPVDDHVRAHLVRLERSGASLHRTRSKARTVAAAPWLLARHSHRGRPPYVLPAGGSSPVGALGYVEAAFELAGQVERGELPEPSHAVVALGSGGTAAGLLLGLRLAGLRTRVVGVVVNDTLRLDPPVLARLARRSLRLLRRRGARIPGPGPGPGDITVTREFLGAGYGHATPESRAALASADLELDPVYTAKAMAGLLGMARDGALGDGPVLFVNTHGPR
jgi:D-cysteine desulfhydrase